MRNAYLKLHLGIGINNLAFVRRSQLRTRRAYCLLAYQFLRLLRDPCGQVTDPAVAFGALADGALGDAAVIGNQAQRLDAGSLVGFDRMPVDLSRVVERGW